MLRFGGVSGIKANDKAVEIRISTFDVVEGDEEFRNLHGVNNKLVIKLSVANKLNKEIKKLDAKIFARSTELQIWSSKGVDNVFNLVSPSRPLQVGDAAVVDVSFPVQYSPAGLVKIKWDTEVILLE